MKAARDNAREALYHSDLNSEAEASPKRRKSANQKRTYEEASSDDDHVRVPYLSLVVPPPPNFSSVDKESITLNDKRPRIQAEDDDINQPSTSSNAQFNPPSTNSHVNGSGENSQFSESHDRSTGDDSTSCMSSSSKL